MSDQRSSRAVREADAPGWEAEADVLVIGVGAGGACVAIEAASAGARVLCLERAGGAGGTTAVSDGKIYLGGGTALQRACGFEDSVEEMQKYLLASCGPEPDAERIRVYCEESPAHFDWLCAQGVPLVILVVGLFVSVFLAILVATVGPIGPGDPEYMSFEEAFGILFGTDGDYSQSHINIVWQVRIPRVLLAAAVGAALACAGTAMQAVFRNPMADPYSSASRLAHPSAQRSLASSGSAPRRSSGRS